MRLHSAVDCSGRPLKHLLLGAVDLLPHALEPCLLGHGLPPDVDEGQRHLPLVPECVRLWVEPATSDLTPRRPRPKPNRYQRASGSCGSRHTVSGLVNCQIQVCIVIKDLSSCLNPQDTSDQASLHHEET